MLKEAICGTAQNRQTPTEHTDTYTSEAHQTNKKQQPKIIHSILHKQYYRPGRQLKRMSITAHHNLQQK